MRVLLYVSLHTWMCVSTSEDSLKRILAPTFLWILMSISIFGYSSIIRLTQLPYEGLVSSCRHPARKDNTWVSHSHLRYLLMFFIQSYLHWRKQSNTKISISTILKATMCMESFFDSEILFRLRQDTKALHWDSWLISKMQYDEIYKFNLLTGSLFCKWNSVWLCM